MPATTAPNSLGFGIACPFRFTSSQDFATAEGRALVKSDLLELLGIATGEVPWRPNLGTRLNRLRHRSNTQALGALARVEIDRAVSRYEPRIRAKSVSSTKPIDNKTELHLEYEVAGKTDTAKTTF
jgi:phage baseplate assembly protein W